MKRPSGSIKLQNPEVRTTEAAAVISHDLLEQDNVFGQALAVK